jgi:hypothetical protein
VKSLTTFFGVPKGEDDMRVVYDGSLPGLNAALWCPWFMLPNTNSHLRTVEPVTFMSDVFEFLPGLTPEEICWC